MDDFAVRLRELRLERGITQDELCAGANFTKTTISRYENGVRNNPGLSELKRLCNYFNVTLDYLTGESGTKEPTGISEVEKHYHSLTDENKLKVISYTKYIRKEQEDAEKSNP